MLKFNAANFYQATTAIQHSKSFLDGREKHDPDFKKKPMRASEGGRAALSISLTRVETLREPLKSIGAQVSLIVLDDMEAFIKEDDDVTVEDLIDFYEQLDTTLRRELSICYVFSLSKKERELFEPGEPLFGEEFERNFASGGAFELDEAAKCRALGRYTAAVFHLMRIMEIGIAAVARCLGIPDPVKPAERNWGNILKAINNGIQAKWPNSADRMHGDGAFFEDVYASLDAVRNPWRNATMHVERKYTPDDAEHIFIAVKGFMKKLASRCDEDGLPLA